MCTPCTSSPEGAGRLSAYSPFLAKGATGRPEGRPVRFLNGALATGRS